MSACGQVFVPDIHWACLCSARCSISASCLLLASAFWGANLFGSGAKICTAVLYVLGRTALNIPTPKSKGNAGFPAKLSPASDTGIVVDRMHVPELRIWMWTEVARSRRHNAFRTSNESQLMSFHMLPQERTFTRSRKQGAQDKTSLESHPCMT